ncbi:beta-lactamase regulating signal transducer with metallopeptidase domain [Lutibacter sp. Hel_I_33_5]|uniref:M56 family metallopeptidase n=1 Tax=Lutibacter sp. Hel_I_33_5 TaxID=1566289 RepID=UPI00119FCB4D|nr:M56 family metallopeptidase [Lutibacter sp. Hel_I_33_5]TVZ56877.1 beta-lactamase regulating signal transducer with metallopeptidase domain [Lutibacter sp. Hel_I_33_5]
MINYIIQVILFQILFLAIYDLILSRETFFNKNRVYLLITPVLSFLVPFIKIPTFQKVVPKEFIIYLPEIMLSPEKVIQQTNWYQNINFLNVLFWLGVFLFLVVFIVKIVKISRLILKNKTIKQATYKLVLLPKKTKAFSFFNYIFLGQDISENQREKIIQHELVHSKQKHSLDLFFFEILKIFMWFNPMIYFYQKRITLLHEYISDAVMTKSDKKENYINNLLSNFFQVENISFVNQFYKQSLIKKRIIMMKKTQSKKMNQLKYLVLIPVLLSMLFYTSCSEIKAQEKFNSKKEVSSDKTEVEELKFNKIDKPPVYPGCKEGDKLCFSRSVQKYFISNFDNSLIKKLGLSKGEKRLAIQFTVDKYGKTTNINVKAPHPELKLEVSRVIGLLPKMIPGEHKGKKVAVKYSIPFVIMVE